MVLSAVAELNPSANSAIVVFPRNATTEAALLKFSLRAITL